MPTIDAAHRNLLTARALHNAQARTGTTQYPVLDWSAIVAGTRTAAGMNGLDTKKDVRRVSLIFSCWFCSLTFILVLWSCKRRLID